MTNKPMLSVERDLVVSILENAKQGYFSKDHGDVLRALLEKTACIKCNDTGEADSGGVHPWGESINIPCDCTKAEEPDKPADGFTIKTNKSARRPNGLKKDQIVEVYGGGQTQIARADKTDWRNVEAWRIKQ